MPRYISLALGVLIVFGVVAAILLRLMPGPHHETDYLVIGAVSTLVSMLALFLALITTTLKSKDVFFKKRSSPSPGDTKSTKT